MSFYTKLVSNEWLTPPPRSPALHLFFTLIACDSSVPAGAFCWEVLHRDPHLPAIHQASWWQWPPRVCTRFSMPAREALACVRTSQDALPHMERPAIWLVDCLPVLQALAKGFSSKPILNALTRCLRNIDGILWIWVPTDLMPADVYSRKSGFSPMRVHPGSILSWPLRTFLSQQLQKTPQRLEHSWVIK